MLKSSLALGPFALASFACAFSASTSAAPDPKGVWLNDTGRGAVEIKNCAGALCGHVVWVKDGADAKGCGKQIIGEARPAGGATWGGGWVYSPEKKRRYDVELTPVGDDKLRVVGYAGVKLFSKTMVWKRAPADLPRCGSTEVAAQAAAPKQAPTASVAVAPVESKSTEAKSPVPKAPEPIVETGKTPEVKAPELAGRGTTVRETTSAEAKGPDVKPTEPAASSKPAAATEAEKSAEGSAAGEEKTAQADEQRDETSDDEPADKGSINLGDLDLGKVLKRTKGGNCKLDLPWVKIEFGCE